MEGNSTRRLIIDCRRTGDADCTVRHEILDFEGFQSRIETEILILLHMHMLAGFEAKRRGKIRRPSLKLEVINDISWERNSGGQSGMSSSVS